MSDYPANLTLLSQLNELIPADTETNNKWPAADRQLRAFIKTFLTAVHDDDGTLKAGSISAKAIGVGTLNGDKLIDETVDGDKLVPGTVDGAALKLETITLDRLDPDIVFPADMIPAQTVADGSITSLQLADGAVTSAKIGVGVITGSVNPSTHLASGNIALNTIDAGTIVQNGASAASPRIPVCAGNDSGSLEVSGDAVAEVVGGKLQLTVSASLIALRAYARFERKLTLVGSTVTLSDYYEAALNNWTLDTTYISSITPKIEVTEQYFKFTEVGTYQIRIRNAGTSTNGLGGYFPDVHRVVFKKKGTTEVNDVVGSVGYSGNMSELSCILVVSTANVEYGLYMQFLGVNTWTPVAGSTVFAVSPIYGVVEIVKL